MAYLDKNGLSHLWDKIKGIVPTKTSELTNDSGFITGYTETDPTVPNHVKNITQNNINSWDNKADTSDIPTKTSDLTNDSGFIDNTYHDSTKQDTLISGTNIKTINDQSILGGGNINIRDDDYVEWTPALSTYSYFYDVCEELIDLTGITTDGSAIIKVTQDFTATDTRYFAIGLVPNYSSAYITFKAGSTFMFESYANFYSITPIKAYAKDKDDLLLPTKVYFDDRKHITYFAVPNSMDPGNCLVSTANTKSWTPIFDYAVVHKKYVDDGDSALLNELDNKQDVLTAGDNIEIENNVISADLSSKQDILTAGDNIEIENDVISADLSSKQDVLTAGDNITIEDNVISATIPESNIITGGAAVKAGYKIDGKDVYVKRVNFGALPNNSSKTVPSGIDFTKNTLVQLNGVAKYATNNVCFAIPFANPSTLGYSIMLNMDNSNNISITTGSDRRSYNAVVHLYYISNQ